MTHEEYLQYHADMCAKMHQLTIDKNSDYCGEDPSPFSNVEKIEKAGVCATEVGILTRMFDKFSRVISFVKKGTLKVNDEKVEDTCLDLANYCIMLAGYLKQKGKK